MKWEERGTENERDEKRECVCASRIFKKEVRERERERERERDRESGAIKVSCKV